MTHQAYWRREFRAVLADGAELKEADIVDAMQVLCRFKPRQFEALDLALRGETQEQIAQALGISQSAVAQRLRSARENIAGILIQLTSVNLHTS